MKREDFFEKLDNFDFDSFGKDDVYDNTDVYQVIQFFANKIYDDVEMELLANEITINTQIGITEMYKKDLAIIQSRTCENCKHYNDFNESSGLCENVESKMTGVDNDDGCNKWEKKDV